nr:hypothetical protein BaRGS_018508 [Batillaria attramentaria]
MPRRVQLKLLRLLFFVACAYFAVQLLLLAKHAAHDHELDLDLEVHDRVVSHRIMGVARALIKNSSMLERVERTLKGWEDKPIIRSETDAPPDREVRQKRKRFLQKKMLPAQPAWDDPDSPGYGGRGVTINKDELSLAERARYDQGYERFKVNEYASSLIPLQRKLRNVTEPECLAKLATYDLDNLPTAGVVIVFHNEAWSILLRTVHSILGASPPQLLSDIILVDDASTMEHLGQQLEDYVALLDKVKLVRLKQRSGLMKARMTGFHHVTGDVAAFLDSHCEVAEGWLEPLLQRIHEDENVLAVPATDTINSDTFAYQATHATKQLRGGMDLDLLFMWIPQLAEENARRGSLFEPMKSPAHLGCCFAMAKKTFLRLGLYDPGLKIWGGENTELSFKTWMCGGSVEIIPCSHAGHMFRVTSQIPLGDDGDVIIKNCLRVAEVWMDEYKVLYHDRIFNQQDSFDFGDVSERVALRKQLGCKSFGWYLKNAYPDIQKLERKRQS